MVMDAHKDAWCWRMAISAQTIPSPLNIAHFPTFTFSQQTKCDPKQTQFMPLFTQSLIRCHIFGLAFESPEITRWRWFSWVKASALRDVSFREIWDFVSLSKAFITSSRVAVIYSDEKQIAKSSQGGVVASFEGSLEIQKPQKLLWAGGEKLTEI